MAKKFCRWEVSAEQVAGDEDLVRELFLRLPVRCLIRYKSVSKQFFSIISDPHFACNHTRRTTNPPIPSGLFFYNSFTKSQQIESVSLKVEPSPKNRTSKVGVGVGVRVPSLSFLDVAAPGATIKILQSCNGLLLLCFTSQSSEAKSYCVCNPTTKNYKILPQPCVVPPKEILNYSLAFNPSESPHYRIVCLMRLVPFNPTIKFNDRLGSFEITIDIYSSENDIWRTSDSSFDLPWDTEIDRGIYWNGAINWIIPNSRFTSFAFLIDEEVIQGTSLPSMLQTSDCLGIRYFGECGGHLLLLCAGYPCSDSFHLLDKDKHTSSWSVKYQVDLSPLICTFPEMHPRPCAYAFSILCVINAEKEQKDLELVLTVPGKLICYNIHHKKTKVLRELPSQVVHTSSHDFGFVFHYIESLYPV